MVLAAAKKIKVTKLNTNKKIAIVHSLFNEKICRSLVKAAKATLLNNHINKNKIKVYAVPGAFEIPLVVKRVLETGQFDGVIALGCIIRGDTPHFEYVSKAVTDGCLRVQLDTNCPVTFGILTVDNQIQADVRSADNDFNKGREAALALLKTLITLERV